MSLIHTLRQPFPYDCSIRNKLGMAAFFGIFIFAFLLLFKPFELDQFSSGRLLLISLVYGLITFSCVFASTTISQFLFPKTFNESSWTTGKEILLTANTIFFVGLVNYLFSPILVDTKLTFYTAIWFQGITIAIGLLPVSLFILLRQNRLLKKFSEQAETIERKLQIKHETIENSKAEGEKIISNKITFLSDYQHEKVELYPDDLYIVTSASNYIKLFHLQKTNVVYSLMRSTLKKAEEPLLPYPNFFKCHRAFIVNLDKVVHVEGNAQGYKLRIEGYEELIPVSRNLNNVFSDKLLAFRRTI